MKRTIATCLVLALMFATTAPGQATSPHVLDWLPQAGGGQGLFDWLHNRLSQWLDVVVRYTSPDIPRHARRLWRAGSSGDGKCVLAADTAVNRPRWGKMNTVLFLVDADTNGDGKIDYRDEFEIRTISASGGVSQTIGQAASAVWSPDGKYIAMIHNRQVEVIDAHGRTVSAADRPPGQIVLAGSLNPQLANDFRALDPRTGAAAPLSEDLAKKYLWLAMMSPDGTRVVYPDATRKNILTRGVRESSGRKLIGGDGLYLDPSWSPDGSYVLYVSTEEQGDGCAKR